MKMKYIFMSMLAALWALTSCSVNDLPASPTIPVEDVAGNWFMEVNASGELDDIPYDTYALYITFQEDGEGLFSQYFLKDGKLVMALASMIEYAIDSKGNISIVIGQIDVPLGEKCHISNGLLIIDMADYDLYGLTLYHPTEDQQQVVDEWEKIIEGWGGSGDDGDIVATEVTNDGANDDALARRFGDN